MPVKRCRLQGKMITSLEEFYDQLALCFPLPEHFGRNLDALWDVLSTDVEGPIEMIWEDSEVSRKKMGGDFDSVVSLLEELKSEREDVTVELR